MSDSDEPQLYVTPDFDDLDAIMAAIPEVRADPQTQIRQHGGGPRPMPGPEVSPGLEDDEREDDRVVAVTVHLTAGEERNLRRVARQRGFTMDRVTARALAYYINHIDRYFPLP